MVARDNRLMGNMQSPTLPPSLPPSLPLIRRPRFVDLRLILLHLLKSPSSPSPPPPQSIAPYLLMLSFSFPTCIYVSAHTAYEFLKVCVCVFVLFLISHTPSTSSARCQISSLPAVPSLSFSLCYSSHPSSSSPPPRSTLFSGF